MSRRHCFALSAVGVLLFSLLGAGCGSHVDSSPAAAVRRNVQVVVVQPGVVERSITVTGSLAAKDQATLGAKVAGRLHQVLVDLGSQVRAGDVLARMQPRDYELREQQAKAAWSQARARLGLPLEGDSDKVDLDKSTIVLEATAILEEARKNRERILKLSAQGISSQSEVEGVEASYQVAINKFQEAMQSARERKAILEERRAEYDLATQQLKDTEVRAPFDGVIAERKASPGEFLPVSAAIVTLVRTDPIRLRLEVPERDAGRVAVGQQVRLTVEGLTNLHNGAIDRLSPSISAENRMLVVESDLKNPGDLRPGLFVRGEIVLSESTNAIVLPREAIWSFAGIEKIFIASNGVAVDRPIVTARPKGDRIEILSGGALGDQVILNPGSLRRGDLIKVTDTVAFPPSTR